MAPLYIAEYLDSPRLVYLLRNLVNTSMTKFQKGHTLSRGSNNGSARFTEDQVLMIFNTPGTQLLLAKIFDVKPATISHIKNGKSWRWLIIRELGPDAYEKRHDE